MKKLQHLRAQVDRIDEQLLRLLNQRARLSQQIGEAKQSVGGKVVDLERENSLLAGLLKKNKGPLLGDALRAIFREVISSSRKSCAVSTTRAGRSGCPGAE